MSGASLFDGLTKKRGRVLPTNMAYRGNRHCSKFDIAVSKGLHIEDHFL